MLNADSKNMEKEKLPQLLSISQVAKILGVSTMTIRRWEKKGLLKSFRPTPTSVRRFKKEDIIKFLKS